MGGRPKSRVVIQKLKHSGASGRVSSGDGGCVGNRKVTLFRLNGFISRKVGRARTGSDGRWRIRKRLKDGRYFAKVDSDGRCRYDTSRTETLR